MIGSGIILSDILGVIRFSSVNWESRYSPCSHAGIVGSRSRNSAGWCQAYHFHGAHVRRRASRGKPCCKNASWPSRIDGYRGFFLNCLAVFLNIFNAFLKVIVGISGISIQTTQMSCCLACFQMQTVENVGRHTRLSLPSLKQSSCLVLTMTCEGQLSLEILTTVMGCHGWRHCWFDQFC